MRVSQLFTKTSKSIPSDETARNAQLLIQAGFIHKEMAGVYAYLPLGLKVLENIKQIVRQEMNAIGGQELIMTALQRQELWESTDRWDDQKVDIWFKTGLKNGTTVGLAWSHEEPIGQMMKNYLESYRDLPISVYQFQTKLRNELRAKSGIMRGREFVMKDLYSFNPSEAAHQTFYEQVAAAYLRVFDRVGLGEITFKTFASGGAFTQFSHEFQTITPAGEDTIYVDHQKRLAVNQEVYSDEVIQQLDLDKNKLQKTKAAEVGNIFSFGTAKSEQLGLFFTDEDGHERPVVLGSYGIGVTRLMGVIAEHFSDDLGLAWPESVSPYKVYLAGLGGDRAVTEGADKLYQDLTDAGCAVLYDDRDERAGAKFADADLLGIPYRVVVSDKTLQAAAYELKSRASKSVETVSHDDLLKKLGQK